MEPVILDEVQKVPELLDCVHLLIEEEKVSFVLCGSSARKLYQAGVNLLGGRALMKYCLPLTYHEIVSNGLEFDLLKAMNRGLIPEHYLDDENYKEKISSYVHSYLDMEINQEKSVRKIDTFYRFLDSVAYSNTELMNYAKIARECGVSSYTVKEYYKILCDTLVGTYVYPLKNNNKRQNISSTPKFYLFDIGIANYLNKYVPLDTKGSNAGKSFEHFIYLEILAYSKYNNKIVDINFYRTNHGLEVDFIISENRDIKLAIECKSSSNVSERSLKGIKLFSSDYTAESLIVVCQNDMPSVYKNSNDQDIFVLPYKYFLDSLWAGKYF